ncbi:MAG: alanine--tRNA ligase [Bacteroidota bacterium]
MKAKEIRQKFMDFFESKSHKIVPSAPMVIKNDPTLMFTNAGMNQFKDFFLGNKEVKVPRVADTQKCLRVSGKHNDLEEVGIDSYHHTMFEMLGNWSFGDYFKKEAIAWAWELLTEVYGIDKDKLYVTIFEGDHTENLEEDDEATEFWKTWIAPERIIPSNKKDNFWEMGETGPCGPCSEIHVDLRSKEERAKTPGKELVNQDHPLVIEIWNLVFIQYNRKADGSLESLPAKHVDTGMGFERLCMVLQGKTSNYATDVFSGMIAKVEDITSKKYTGSYESSASSDIAMRVIVDHLRAVSFAIADGQLPSNTGAGYVIRRILRRAVRYYFSFLDYQEPLLHQLVPQLSEDFKAVFPELDAQQGLVAKIILEEEKNFLRTLESGLKRLDSIDTSTGIIDGRVAFELYDTFGFPIDLTRLIASEKGFKVDEAGFETALTEQRERSKKDAAKAFGDWNQVIDDNESVFIGYGTLEAVSRVLKYRTVKVKDKDQYQVVLNKTPFYPEGGGQVGDIGLLFFGDEKVPVLDTKRENDLIIHFVKNLPEDITLPVKAVVNKTKRKMTENNHSATHLVHSALREVLGTHVQQKGSLVNDKYLRFDFSHFQKVTEEEIAQIETIVNGKIRENIARQAELVPIEDAKKAGAMMLFGEKYGDTVRMVTFDPEYSVELCGGCHVPQTGVIGLFKIIREESVASGVRRIEALTADGAEAYVNDQAKTLAEIKNLFKNPKNIVNQVSGLQDENKALKRQLEKLNSLQANLAKDKLKNSAEQINGLTFIGKKVDLDSSDAIKKLAFDLRKEYDNLFLVLGAELNGKANLTVALSDNLTSDYNAGQIIRELAKEIQGGGGGQPFFATAGGKKVDGIIHAISKARTILDNNQ